MSKGTEHHHPREGVVLTLAGTEARALAAHHAHMRPTTCPKLPGELNREIKANIEHLSAISWSSQLSVTLENGIQCCCDCMWVIAELVIIVSFRELWPVALSAPATPRHGAAHHPSLQPDLPLHRAWPARSFAPLILAATSVPIQMVRRAAWLRPAGSSVPQCTPPRHVCP